MDVGASEDGGDSGLPFLAVIACSTPSEPSAVTAELGKQRTLTRGRRTNIEERGFAEAIWRTQPHPLQGGPP